jgi:hypothetical protein
LGFSLLPDGCLTLLGPQNHFGALQLGFVIFKTIHCKSIWGHKTVTPGLIASFEAIHFKRDN